VLDLSQVVEKKPSSRTHPRYNTTSVLLYNNFVEPTDPRIQEKKLHAMEFIVSNCCYLLVLVSTVLQTNSKVEHWQCRESKLTLPPTHQRMLAREHIPFIYVISRIYADKARLKTSLWVSARQMMQP